MLWASALHLRGWPRVMAQAGAAQVLARTVVEGKLLHVFGAFSFYVTTHVLRGLERRHRRGSAVHPRGSVSDNSFYGSR